MFKPSGQRKLNATCDDASSLPAGPITRTGRITEFRAIPHSKSIPELATADKSHYRGSKTRKYNNYRAIIRVMEFDPAKPSLSDPPTRFEQRAKVLKERVVAAANALQAQGISPTVARLRAALGGGSPNDLAPALKAWRLTAGVETVVGRAAVARAGSAVPTVIADLVTELWQRAQSAAVLEARSGPGSLERVERSAEARALRTQLEELRQQMDRDAQSYGELKAQAARHEAIAREALDRARKAETRERALLRDLGTARARIAELNASAEVAPARTPTPRRPKTKVELHVSTTRTRPAPRRVKTKKALAKTSRSSATKRKRSAKRKSYWSAVTSS